MPEAASTRLGLIGPSGSDDITLGDDIIRAIIAQLEAVGATFLQGTTRPSATAARMGMFFISTTNGNISYCTGTGWDDLSNGGVGAIPIEDLADPTAGKFIGSSGGLAAAVYPPGHEIGYDPLTSLVTVSATNPASPTTVIAGSSHTFDGEPVIATFFAPEVQPAADAAGAYITISLFEGSTDLGVLTTRMMIYSDSAITSGGEVMVSRRFTPSAGAHTYKICAYQSGGDGTIEGGNAGAGTLVPGYLRFTKV